MNAMATRRYPEGMLLSEAGANGLAGGGNYWLPLRMGKLIKAQGRVDTAYCNSYLDFRVEGERYKNYTIANLTNA